MEPNNTFSSGQNVAAQGDLWYVDNYILLKDYYDRTISRIAARCVRQKNIAMEEYPFYGYILDVLEEISETGDFIIEHPALHPYLEKKYAGGLSALKKNLSEFKTELHNNASPEMVKQDKDELNKVKEALGSFDKSFDPTVGAGMSMDEVVEKLLHNQQVADDAVAAEAKGSQPQAQAPQPAQTTPQQGQPQPRPVQQQQRPSGMAQQPQQAQRQAQPNSQMGQPQMQRPAPTQTGGQPNQAPRPAQPQGQPQPRPAAPQSNSPTSPFNNGNK